MLQIFPWVKEKISAVASTTTSYLQSGYATTATYVQSGYDTAAAFASIPYNQAKKVGGWVYKAINFVINPMEFWQGFSRMLDLPKILPAVFKPKTGRILLESFAANIVLYMGSVLFYQAALKQYLRNIPGMQDSYTEYAMDIIATWYFMRLALRMMANNALYITSLVKAVGEENPHRELVKADCSTMAVIQANIESPIFFTVQSIVLNLISSRVPLMKIITTPVLAHVYGQALAEYNLTNLCTRHRYYELAKNNSFINGIGVSFMLLYLLATWAISHYAGVSGYFINDPVFNFLFQFFIMTTLLIDQVYPGKTLGKDLFYYLRAIIGGTVKQITDFVIAALRSPNTQTFWTTLGEALLHLPGINYLKHAVLYEDYHDLDKFVKTRSMQMFLDMRGDDIQGFLKWLIHLRRQPRIRRLATVLPYVPFVSPQLKAGLAFLVEKKLNGVLEEVNSFIDAARLKVNILDRQALRQLMTEKDDDSDEAVLANNNVAIEDVTENAENYSSLPEISDFVVVEKEDAPEADPVLANNATTETNEQVQNIANSSIVFIEDYKDEDEKHEQDEKKANGKKEDDLNEWTMVNESAKKSLHTNSLFRKPTLPAISLSGLKKLAFQR